MKESWAGGSGCVRLDARRLRAGELERGTQQELDVVFRLYFCGIHTSFYARQTTPTKDDGPRRAA